MEEHFLIFVMEGRRYALPLAQVERVLSVVEITPLPGAPVRAVRGVINVHGAIVPVLDVRADSISHAPQNAQDEMILVLLEAGRRAALLCDKVEGVRVIPRAERTPTNSLLPETLAGRGGVLQVDGELIGLSNLDEMLEQAHARPTLDALYATGG